MTSEFREALDQLEGTEGAVGRGLITRFSGLDPEDVTLFRERFPRLSDERRDATLTAMVESAEADFQLNFDALFRAALSDPLPSVRRQAVEGLWEDERLDLVRILLRMLEEDPDDSVRAAAATSLGRYVYRCECDELDCVRGERVRAGLERAVSEDRRSVEVARRALESLAYINDETITRLIDRAYTHESPLMRQSAVFAMGRNADHFWTENVLAELHSDDPAMRFEAARASGELRQPRALPVLARLVAGDPDAEVRQMAVWAMGEIGGKRAQGFLEQLADGEDEALADAAEEALARIEFAHGSLDLLVLDVPGEVPEDHAQHPEHEHADADAEETESDEEAGPDDSYLREFQQYTGEYDDEEPDEADDDSDEEWPDNLLERQ